MNDEKIIYVLDTNILLHEPFAFLSFKEHDVVVPMTVLEELDSIKDRRKDVSRDARVAIRALEDTLVDATPEEVLAGVKLPQNDEEHPSGRLSIFNDYTLEQKAGCLSFNENDNRIINAALHLQKKKAPNKVVLVTKDINMRLKAKGAGLAYVEDYRTDQLIDDIKFLTKGYHKFEGDFWQHVNECESETEGRNTTHYIKRDVLPNTYMNEYLIDDSDNFAGKVTGWDDEKLAIMDLSRDRLMAKQAWGIHPKNIYQGMALDALLDPSIDLVILTGPAGCGKTGVNRRKTVKYVKTMISSRNERHQYVYNPNIISIKNLPLSITSTIDELNIHREYLIHESILDSIEKVKEFTYLEAV